MDRLDEIVAERDAERSHCPDESCCLLCDTIEIALALRKELLVATWRRWLPKRMGGT